MVDKFFGLIWGMCLGLVITTSIAHAATEVRIKNVASNLCLEPQGGSVASGTLLQQNNCNTGTQQAFYVVAHADGSWIFKNKKSNLCIEIKDTTVTRGSVLQQAPCVSTSSSHQHFTPLFLTTGIYTLVSQLNASCFQVRDSSLAPGALMLTYRCSLAGAQKFKFEIVSGSLPLITTMPTDAVITPVTGPVLPTVRYGVNLSGAESGNLSDNNTYGYDYAYPKKSIIDHFAALGFTTIRVPFKIGRLQPKLNYPLDVTELSRLDTVVQYARSKGLYVVLDPHDYGKMRGSDGNNYLIGTSTMPASRFANFWARLARVYSKQPNVFFNIMNEPNVQTPEQWQSVAIAALNAIRSVGAKQLALIPGTAWTGASRWVSTGNARVWTSFKDISYAFDVHQYLDYDNSGTHEACSSGVGVKRLTPFADWARANGHRGFIGEMGWSGKSDCLTEGDALLKSIYNYRDVFVGWTYWGASWYNGFMTLNPTSDGQDRPQTHQLLSFF